MTKYLSRALILALLVFSATPLMADSISEIIAKTKRAVVEIVTRDATGTPKDLGTGFFVSPDGLVVTNLHVIEGADSITAVSNKGATFLFERVVAQPVGVDLVVLKFHAADVPFLKLGESLTAVEGQKVIVIGHPTSLMGTVSDGTIAAFLENRSIIQITASISHELSGSPVMDETGQIIGIATLVSAVGQNLNFVIPAEEVPAELLEPPGSAPTTATLTPAIEAKAYFDSGLASLNRKEYDKAIGDFTEAIRLDPNNTLAHFNRGFAYDNTGNYEKAVSDYTEAIRFDSDFVPSYFNRGIAYGHQHNYERAVSDYTEAIRLDPNYASAYCGRGYAYQEQGNFDKAIADYTEAIRLEPNYVAAYVGRGNIYLRTGNRAEASADFATAKRLEAGQ